MEQNASLDSLASEELIARFAKLLAHERKTTAALLRAMEMIDRRRLWAEAGYPSMFSFCVERYRMSEAVANKRIRAARTGGRFPVLFSMVASGEIHLTGVSQLAKHLSEENHREVLQRARHRTMREIDELIAELAPQPERASRLAALPTRTAPPIALSQPMLVRDEAREPLVQGSRAVAASSLMEGGGGGSSCPPVELLDTRSREVMSVTPQLPAASVAASMRAADPKAVAPGRYRLSVTLSQEGHDRLRQLQGLMGHQVADGDPAAIVERALEVLLEQSLKRKAARTNRPRKDATPSPKINEKRAREATQTDRPRKSAHLSSKVSAKRSRTIPAHLRRAVWERDGGRCTFVSPSGHRCNATHRIEFHHKVPWGKGGEHTVENVELRCTAHNQLHAERDYGRAFMDRKRMKSRVEEGRAGYFRWPRGLRTARTAALYADRSLPSASLIPTVSAHDTRRKSDAIDEATVAVYSELYGLVRASSDSHYSGNCPSIVGRELDPARQESDVGARQDRAGAHEARIRCQANRTVRGYCGTALVCDGD